MKVTIKTMDLGSKDLDVPEDFTVEKLKDEILKEMGIPLDQQRLIFQGKPLKDTMKLKDCGVDGKVIHLVKRPPPSAVDDTASPASAEATPTTVPSSSTVVADMQTIVFPGEMPSHNALTQVTQNIVDRIVSTLTSQGTEAEVSAETITTDAAGTTRRATVSARSDNMGSLGPPANSQAGDGNIASTITTNATTTVPSVAESLVGGATAGNSGSNLTKMEVDEKPVEKKSTAGPSDGASGSTSFATAEDEVKPKESSEVAEDDADRAARRRRNHNQNHTLYSHARTVRRCLDFTTRVLNRYDRGSARVKAKIAAEKRGEASGGEVLVEAWPEVEPMEVMESADGPSEEAKLGAGPDTNSDTEITGSQDETGKYLIIKKKRISQGVKQPMEEKYAIMDDPDMPDLPARFYGMMVDDLQAVYRRLSPLMEEYQKNATEDRELTEAEAVLAAQIALTVRDSIYYIGHGNVSLARLHINYLTPPPRYLRLAAPHKTEVRRVMMSMRRCFPSMHRMHEPSGYIVDISRDGDGAGGDQSSGERRTTRAVVNRSTLGVGGGMPGYGGMFGPMLGGILGARRRFDTPEQPRPQPSEANSTEAKSAPVPAGPTSTSTASAPAPSNQPPTDKKKRGSALKPPSDDERRLKVKLNSADDVTLRQPNMVARKIEEHYMEGWDQLSEEEVKKREKRVKRLEEQKTLRNKLAVERYDKDVADRAKEEEKWQKQRADLRKKWEAEEEKREQQLKEEQERRKRAAEERKNMLEARLRSEMGGASQQQGGASQQQGGASQQQGRASQQQGKASQQQGGASITVEGNEAAQEGGAEGGNKDDETPRYLARLLSELITGVADPNGPHRPSQKPEEGSKETEGEEASGATPSGNGNGNAATGEDKVEEIKEEEKKEGEASPPPRKSFAERYAGPEGTTVTIQAAPTAPFGMPMEGPSLSIRNPGAGAEPEMTINFPVPPAFHLLQSLLQRAEERHRERQANGESSSSSSDEDGDDEGEGGPVRGGAGGEGGDKPKKKRTRPHVPRPFVDADGEVGSTSEAGDLDSMDSDKEEPPEFNDRSMAAGEHMTMLEAMREVRGKIGMNPECESEDEEQRSVSRLEQFLKMISRELKVREVMKILLGDIGCLERTQPNFQDFIKDKLLDGAEPINARKDLAVCRFLENLQTSLEAIEHTLPIRDPGIDIVETVGKLMYLIIDEVYDHIVKNCTLRDQMNKVFAKRLQKWAKENSQLFACVMRHCVEGEHHFDDLIGKLVALLFPPSTPANILQVCIESVLKWLDKALKESRYEPLELDRYICWKEGFKSTPNISYTLSKFTKVGMGQHDGLDIPYPPKESCPGGDAEEEELGGATGQGGVVDVPPGVPKEWVATINRDSEAHSKREGPQQPYSEAYLSGMPAKKRKLDTSDPCTKSAQDLLFDAMEYAISKSGVTTTSGATDAQMVSMAHHSSHMASALCTNIHQFHRQRLQDAEATVEQYPHAMEFYHLDTKAHEERLDK